MSARPEQTLRVRRASRADADAVLALVPRLVEFGPPRWRDAEQMTSTDLDVIAAALRCEGDDPAVIVSELGGRVVGFIHVHSKLDYYRRRAHGHVADLVVAEGSEGLGIATRLLAEAEEWARSQGWDWLSISVFGENERAAGLYERHGFGRDTLNLLKPLE
jgi:GNAT superfamily N-acetyltransferase